MSLYQRPIPPIDIKPKAESDDLLSLYRFWDYIRLLGWILYDPHKLDAYIQKANSHKTDPNGDVYWQNAYDALSWQVSLLVVVKILLFLTFYWQFSALTEFDKWANIAVGIALAATQIFALIMFKEQWNQALAAIPIYAAFCIMLFLLLSEYTMQKGLWSYVITCSFFGLFCGIAIYTFSYFTESVWSNLELQLVVGLNMTLLAGLFLFWLHGDLRAALGNIGGIIAFLLAVTRFDDWLRAWFALLGNRGALRGETALNIVAEHMPRVSLLPFYKLSVPLKHQLETNWNTGLRSALNLCRYTRQKNLIERTIGEVLGGTGDSNVVERVAQLDGAPEWTLADVLPRTQSRKVSQKFYNRRLLQNNSLEQSNPICVPRPMQIHIPRDSAAHAAIAGFYYLRHNRPEEARDAFKEIKDSGLAREMETVSETLHLLNSGKNLSDADKRLPAVPGGPKRKETWGILKKFHDIIRLAWVLRCSKKEEHVARLPEIMEEILTSITGLTVKADSGLAEASMLSGIAKAWKKSIDTMRGNGVTQPARKSIENPFIHAEPIREKGYLLVGRTALLKRLNQALLNDKLPLILIYGSRQAGKTSLFYSAVEDSMHSVHISLRQVVRDTTRTHLLDIISDLVEQVIDVMSPNYQRLSQNPYKSFASYIREICRDIRPDKLLIVLDEFEYLDEVITSSAKRQDLARYFYSLAQTEPNLHFVLITTQTPSDIQRSYRRPFSTSLYPIEVDYLQGDDVRRLLRYPTKDFLPYCDESAIERVMELTGGQPYLVQLIGFYLLHYYNHQLTSETSKVDPFFTHETVNAILHSQDFQLQCNHYFLNLLDEVEQIDPTCVELLQRIATRSGRILPVDLPDLNRLREHDIVHQNNQRWDISIRLFAQCLRDRDM